MAKINLPASRKGTQYVKFQGGYDVTTPLPLMSPGTLINSVNVEGDILKGGYSIIQGYEPYDGHPAPQTATYRMLAFTTAGTVTVGTTITGATSGATGVVVKIIPGTAFVLTDVTGTWGTENTTAGGASVVGPTYLETDVYFNAEYLHLAYDNRRNSIQAVPGENEVRGVVYYKGVVYAFRDNLSPGTGIIMYKATASGWSSMAGLMGKRLVFTNANTSVEVGDVLTQGATTANVLKVVVITGTLASGVNSGNIYIDTPVGPGFAAGAATTTGAGALTLTSGTVITQTIVNKGGKYDFAIANFGGTAGSEKVYASNPYNVTFEWDGTFLVNMALGLGGILPEFNVYHKNRLFLSYQGSLIYSAIGDPYLWVNDGGGEIAVGDNVTAFMSQPGSDVTAALAVYCRNRTYVLYGTSVSDWNLVTFAEESGAIPYSAQKIGNTYVVDDVGVTTLQTAQEFGNFAAASISRTITPWLESRRALLSSSLVCRKKQQYRLYFSSAEALYITLDKNEISYFPVQGILGQDFYCTWGSETYGGGVELMWAGSSDGYVYQLDTGDTMAGATIQWNMQFPYNDSGSHRILKRYRNLTLDVTADAPTTFRVGYKMDAGYNYTEEQPDNEIRFNDIYSQYDIHYGIASNPYHNTVPVNVKLSGVADSISIYIGASALYNSYGNINFTGAFLETSMLRQKR